MVEPQSDRVLIATRSSGKLRELRELFAARGVAVVDLVAAGVVERPEVEDGLEVFETFEQNALAKARHFHGLTGRATVADDSGLVVSALGGQPGVRSKRWSGRADLVGQALDDENNRLLMERLGDASGAGDAGGAGDRRAHYVCAAAYVDGVREVVRRGEVHGTIARIPRGSGGFGYDPYFEAEELGGRTFGEVSAEAKARISHRARAFAALLEALVADGAFGDRMGS